MMAKPQKTTTSPPPPPPEADFANERPTWNQSWSLDRRLLEVRKLLKGTQLWKNFEIQRSFDAFSIHAMAAPIEEKLNSLGLTSHFEPLSWDKNGNQTVLKGAIIVTCVDNGETKEFACLGEATDNGDKGISKATSTARKNGMIGMLNLSIGFDIEDGQEKTAPERQQSGGGQPEAPPAAPPPPPAPEEPRRTSTETYNLQQVGKPAIAVLHTDLVQRVTILVSQIHTGKDLQAFCNLNSPSFDAFFRNDAEKGAVLQQILQSRFKIVKEKEAA